MKKNKRENPIRKLKEETLQGVLAIIFFALAVFFVLASFHNGGAVGETLYAILDRLFGIGYFLLPAILFILGYSSLKDIKSNFAFIKIAGSLILFLSGLGIIGLLFAGKGGLAGGFISAPLLKLFDLYVSLIFLSALFLISLLVIFDTHLKFKSIAFWRQILKNRLSRKKEEKEEYYEEEIEESPEEINNSRETKKTHPSNKSENEFEKDLPAQSGSLSNKIFEYFGRKTSLPPLSLLEKDKGRPEVGDIKANSNIIKRTLKNFGINVEMDEISIGPSVTRYALKPAEGIKLSRIMGLQNDLSLALAAHPLRIEAPIPGKSLVGIEIPNSARTTVGLATLFATKEYKQNKQLLTVALGKDVSGQVNFIDLAKAPHLLIAGATGAGKSVTIHALINSLLFRATPENLKFIMIDPKRVELTQYKGIPHLLTPVITGAKKTILALKWALKEMDRRYDILESAGVRDIQSYHKNIVAPAYNQASKNKEINETDLPETMPYIVIIIDELADIMQAYPRELEAAVVRLAQMSRAIGIHLIFSTQRPSVNVITGLIKANIPSRIALQVASQVDSRTILDVGGAEKLLGAGDMLYISGEMSKPKRIQSAFISETELKKVTTFLKEAYKNEIPDEVDIDAADKDRNPLFDTLSFSGDHGGNDDEEDDLLYEDAKETILAAGKASTSYLQRKLRVGYARAARLMDKLEENGIIGPADGSKPRPVLATEERDPTAEETKQRKFSH
ncbi:MAG: DUF87 domain-containing protein [Candidatus Pacebacteria bacterium]|nr:DUF87 domain-containing protein [Candidatus Paceibacterota bacterium]